MHHSGGKASKLRGYFILLLFFKKNIDLAINYLLRTLIVKMPPTFNTLHSDIYPPPCVQLFFFICFVANKR